MTFASQIGKFNKIFDRSAPLVYQHVAVVHLDAIGDLQPATTRGQTLRRSDGEGAAMEGDNGACPACLEPDARVGRSYSLEIAARHFAPPRRDPARHEQMKGLLRELWGGRETVELRRCRRCGFSFAHPWVAGNARFYNLLTGEQPQYPHRRWEFDRTIESLLEEYTDADRHFETRSR